MSSNDEISDENLEKDTDEEIIVAPPKKRTKKADKVKSRKSKSSEEDNDEDKPKKRRKKTASIFRDGNPTTQEMICEAIANLDDGNGSSVLAIKNYIFHYFKVNEDRFKPVLKKALDTLIKNNKIGRPKGQEEFKALLVGRYILIVEQPAVKEVARERPASLRQPGVLNRINKQKKSGGKKKKKRRV